MDVLIVIDMQEDLLLGQEKHDLSTVIERINRLAERVRNRDGRVVFIQHDGSPGEDFAPCTPGWEIISSLQRRSQDLTIRKTLNDAFRDTSLQSCLKDLGVKRILVTGWATDLCVDATVRSAASLGFNVVVVSDCHTVSDRPHMDAERVIEHHQWIWTNLISLSPVKIAREAEI